MSKGKNVLALALVAAAVRGTKGSVKALVFGM